MCCTQLAGNTGRKNCQKFVIWAPSHNFIGCVFATKACINNRKKTCLLHMSAQYVELGPLPAEICWRVWGTPANFNGFRVLASLLRQHCSTEAIQTLHDVWPSPGLVDYIYIFGGSCPLTEFCQVQNSLCVQVLHSPILAASLHGTPAEGVSQTKLCGVEKRAPPIFGRAAITLGIGQVLVQK